MPGSGITLPLDLANIAARCKGSFYAPRRFAAVQLAYSNPRCRVLIFHTGRLVGTGTGGAVAARLAIARAQRQLAEEANVHLHTRNFAVINRACCLTLPSREHLLTPLSISSTQRLARRRCGPLSTATPSPRSTRGSRTSTALLSWAWR